MKTRMVCVLSALALLSVALAGPILAREAKGAASGKETSGIQADREDQGVNAFMTSKIVGSSVRNMGGEELGKIQDVVIDVDTGRVLYAVLDFGGFMDIGGKLFPVPWHSLAPLPSEGIFFLDMSKEELKKAPGYDKNSLPDMGSTHWGTQVAKFYHLPDRYAYYNYDYPPTLYPQLAQKDPFAGVFDTNSMKTIEGKIIKVDRLVPEKGTFAQTQVKLILLTDQRKPVPVYVGPDWYVATPNGRIPFKSGAQVTASGSWIQSQPEPFLIATSLSWGGETLEVRQKDGAPLWNAWKTIPGGEKFGPQ